MDGGGNKVISVPSTIDECLFNFLSLWNVESVDHVLLRHQEPEVLSGHGGEKRAWVQKQEHRTICQGSTPAVNPKARAGS